MNEYGRPIAGRLNGITPEPGTILGPKAVTREYVVVLGGDETGVDVGYATHAELEALREVPDAPRSTTEARLLGMLEASR